MIKLLIWTLSFWKPWVENYSDWFMAMKGSYPPDFFWFSLDYFTDHDFYGYYVDDYLIQTLIRKLKL